MLRELVITIYLFIFKFFFSFFKLFPLKKKTTLVASFGGNILFTAKEIEAQTEDSVIILKTSKCPVYFARTSRRRVLNFETNHIFHWLSSVYHLATSHNVIVDNYYGFLAVTNFKPETQCIQLWHAAGAIKQFGLKDLSIVDRSPRAFKRFNEVYKRFDQVVVGSEHMAAIFRESFGLSEEQILRTGVPRTDFFFDERLKDTAKKSLTFDFPAIKEKKVILYAPTYRDDELDSPQLMLDLDKLYKAFKYDYVLFLRLHPAVNGKFENKYPGFVYNVSSYSNVNQLLVIADILITDYSSIPFEYSLLNKPMIFYAYDLEEYEKARGFWENYEDLVPGPIVKTTNEVIQVIREGNYDLDRVRIFAEEWNEYSKGHSSEALVQSINKKRLKQQLHT